MRARMCASVGAYVCVRRCVCVVCGSCVFTQARLRCVLSIIRGEGRCVANKSLDFASLLSLRLSTLILEEMVAV